MIGQPLTALIRLQRRNDAKNRCSQGARLRRRRVFVAVDFVAAGFCRSPKALVRPEVEMTHGLVETAGIGEGKAERRRLVSK